MIHVKCLGWCLAFGVHYVVVVDIMIIYSARLWCLFVSKLSFTVCSFWLP